MHIPTFNDLLKIQLAYIPETGIFYRVLKNNKYKQIGTIQWDGYIRIYFNHRRHYAHVLAWRYMTGEWPKYTIDHIDRNKSNNAWNNLRDIPQTDNNFNTGIKSNNTSGFIGVSFIKSTGKWQARGWLNKRCRNLGMFDTPEKAHEAVIKFKQSIGADV